eukprot:124933-Amphidinium_carterae.1
MSVLSVGSPSCQRACFSPSAAMPKSIMLGMGAVLECRLGLTITKQNPSAIKPLEVTITITPLKVFEFRWYALQLGGYRLFKQNKSCAEIPMACGSFEPFALRFQHPINIIDIFKFVGVNSKAACHLEEALSACGGWLLCGRQGRRTVLKLSTS